MSGDRRQILRAGDMRDRVIIERLDATGSGYSSGSEGWSILHTCRAQIMTVDGPGDGEQVIADALRSINLVQIRVHNANAISDLSANDRILNARTNEVYNVTKVTDPDLKGRILVIDAERNRPHG